MLEPVSGFLIPDPAEPLLALLDEVVDVSDVLCDTELSDEGLLLEELLLSEPFARNLAIWSFILIRLCGVPA